jgi:predicted HicB family RNase H-like nuclease
MHQQALIPDLPDQEPCEYRKARMQLVWPPSVKQRIVELAASAGVSINEFVLRVLQERLAKEQPTKQAA